MLRKNLELNQATSLQKNWTSRSFSSQGFTLMEVVISLVIGVIGVLIFSSGVLSVLQSADFFKTTITRDELALTIRRALINPKSFKITANNNPVMKAVVTNDYSTFGDVYSNQVYGIHVYDVSGMQLTGASADHDSAEDPRYFTNEGFPCSTPGSSSCRVKITASFMIQGSPLWASPNSVVPTAKYPSWPGAPGPDFMLISYTIEILSDADEIERKPLTGSVFISLDDLPK